MADQNAEFVLTEAECSALAEVIGRPVSPHGYLAIAVERIIAARLARVLTLADLYDENGRTRTPRPPWAHTATEVRNAAGIHKSPGLSTSDTPPE